MLYLLSEKQQAELEAINKLSQKKVILCDHGNGVGVEDAFLELAGYEKHVIWLESKNITPIDIPKQTIQ